MAHPLAEALEQAFADVRDQPVPLGERLRLIAELVRDRGPQFMDEVDRFVGRLEAARAGASAPQVGEPMPEFVMPDHDGRLVSLAELLAKGPAVIAFHRGHWCIYCRLNMAGLAEVQDRLAPARLVAVSAETQHYTRSLRSEARAEFPFLTDVGGGYALSLNLAIWVDEAMARLIDSAGWDVPAFQGGGGWLLPIPSVFVVRQDGIIAARHVDPDYRRRMELDALLKAVERLRGEPG